MKKEILIIFMFLGLCFSQTGMKVDKGESGFGVWLEASEEPDCDGDCPRLTKVSLDYMFDFGLEMGIEGGTVTFSDTDEEIDVQGASLAYHIKSNDGGNFSLGASKNELSFEEEVFQSTESIYLSYYGKNKSFFTLSQQAITNEIDGFEYDPREFISFGGIINFGKGGLLIGYELNTDIVEDAFEDEDFDLLKNGLLTLSLGGVF